MNAECRMQSAECRMQNAECRMQNAELKYEKSAGKTADFLFCFKICAKETPFGRAVTKGD